MRDELIAPTPERIAKGGLVIHHDLDGNFLSAAPDPEIPIVIEWLREREWVSDTQHWAARRFHACHHAYQNRMSAKTARWDGEPTQSGEKSMADDYTKIIRHLARPDCELALWVCETRYRKAHRSQLFCSRHRISDSLDKLIRAVKSGCVTE